jgi:hypothetical protein
MEGTRLPLLGLARVPSEDVDDRLNEGYEELRTRRVLEFARAFRDGEALAPQQRVPALFPRSDKRRAVARSTVKYTQLESLDEEIRRAAEKEKKMQTQDKVFTLVHDRRTKKTLMLAQTVTRLPKLDLSRVHSKQGHGQAHTERSEAARRRGEKHQAEGKAEKKEKHGKHGKHGMYKGEVPHTDRPAPTHGVQVHESPAAVKKAAAKASTEVTEWKRQSKVKLSHRPRIEPERSRAIKLPSLGGTWRQRVAGATASEETTEWKGLTKVHKLQQSWLNSETEFRTLLASFGANYLQSNQSYVCGGESQSFFLTASSPAPNAASEDLVERDEDSSENEERMNGMTVSKRRLTIVAPTITLDYSDDDDDDNDAQEFVEASQLRAQVRQGAASSYAEKQQHAAEPEAPAPTASDTRRGGTEQREDAEAQIDTNSRGDASKPPSESTIATEPLANGMNLDVELERNGALAAYVKLRSANFQHAETDSEIDPLVVDDAEEEEEESGESLPKAKAVYEVGEEEQTDAACEEATETPESTAPLEAEEDGRNPRQETAQRKQKWARGIGEQVSSISNLPPNSPPRNREAHAHLLHSDSPSINQSRSGAPFGTSDPEVDKPTGTQEEGKVRSKSLSHGEVSASSECSGVHPPPGARSCLALISTSAPAWSTLLPLPHPGPGARSCLALIATSGEGCVQPCPPSNAQV